MAPRLPHPSLLPGMFGPKDHILTYSKSFPSGPQVQQVRLKYPYMAAQTLADNIAYQANEGGEKSNQIVTQLFQAMGNVGTGKNARPVTGVHIKISGTSHVEKTFSTTVQYRRGSMAHGVLDHKMKTIAGRMGARTTQVKLCSAAFPF